MLTSINNKRAQATVGEYALSIFLVLAVMSAMTIYFKRGIQARIHDARDFMVNDVRARTAGSYDGDLYLHYEPYYTDTDATVRRNMSHTTRLSPGVTSGAFRKTIIETTGVEVSSETLPPKDFELTTPGN